MRNKRLPVTALTIVRTDGSEEPLVGSGWRDVAARAAELLDTGTVRTVWLGLADVTERIEKLREETAQGSSSFGR